MAGAKFTIYDKDGVAKGASISNSLGIVSFGGIEFGKYTIKETTPPTGYLRAEKEIVVNVTLGALNTVLVTASEDKIINTRIPSKPPGSGPPIVPPMTPPVDPPIDIDGDLPAGGVTVPGTQLPATGGIGKVNFYFTGGLLLLLGVILRRRVA